MRDLSRIMIMFFVLIGASVTQAYPFVKLSELYT